MKPEEAIKVLENYTINLIEYAEVSEDSIPVQTYRVAIQALEKQVAKRDKEVTWERIIKSIRRNTYEVEQEMLDPSDRSVAMDEMIPVVNQGFVLGLLYSIAEGNTIILPPK